MCSCNFQSKKRAINYGGRIEEEAEVREEKVEGRRWGMKVLKAGLRLF